MTKKTSDKIEQTRATYEKVAQDFSQTRKEFWSELSYLAEHVKSGDRALDLGCGNGRFYPLIRDKGISYTGIDTSKQLIAIAKDFYPEANFLVGDGMELPFEQGAFDVVYSFAVIHHLPKESDRKKFLQEIHRVLRPGGKLIITTWDLWRPNQAHRIFKSILQALIPFSGKKMGDIDMTFGKDKHPRFVHAFLKPAFIRTLIRNGFTISGSEIADRPNGKFGNIVVIANRSTL